MCTDDLMIDAVSGICEQLPIKKLNWANLLMGVGVMMSKPRII